MKVAIYKPNVYPLFKKYGSNLIGGAEKQMYLLGKELANQEEVSVSYVVRQEDIGKKKLKENKITFYGYKIPSDQDNILKKISCYLLIALTIKADILIFSASGSILFLIGLISRLRGIKLIYWTAFHWDVDKKEIIKWRGYLDGHLFILGLRLCNIIFLQNEEDHEKMLKELGLRGKVMKMAHYITNKPNLNEKKYILWVASSQHLKRPEKCLEIAKEMKNVDFIIICNKKDPNVYYPVKQEAKNIENVEFKEKIPLKEMDEIFKKAKIFINTSDLGCEGFPNTFVEATKTATPIISLNVNPDKFIDIYNCGFCCEGDLDLMIQKIKLLLEDKNLYTNMANNAYKYASENHNIKKIIKVFHSFLFQI